MPVGGNLTSKSIIRSILTSIHDRLSISGLRHHPDRERALKAASMSVLPPIVLKKSFFADDLKFLGPLVRLSLRGEGSHQLSQKRSLALVSILQSLGAAEIANARDFRIAAILEFFNTIRHKLPFHNRSFREGW
jgi:hypothetical protein